MIKVLFQIAQQNPYGFTYDLKSLSHVKLGYVAAYNATQNCFGIEGLQTAILHAMNHNQIIGGWFNSADKNYYFDSCKVFTNKLKAIEFGRTEKQYAIYDLFSGTEIIL